MPLLTPISIEDRVVIYVSVMFCIYFFFVKVEKKIYYIYMYERADRKSVV